MKNAQEHPFLLLTVYYKYKPLYLYCFFKFILLIDPQPFVEFSEKNPPGKNLNKIILFENTMDNFQQLVVIEILKVIPVVWNQQFLLPFIIVCT